MSKNPLLVVKELGQSIWLDYIHRDMLISGKLRQLIEQDGLRGMTSNPKIFKQAIADGDSYDDTISKLAQDGWTTDKIYQILTVEDVQQAADIFRPCYEQTKAKDCFVSLEVSPHLAYDTEGTITEARNLWEAVNRPNVFIKAPATPAGLPAIEQLISEGVNVNVTLLFGLPRYRKVASAYIAGLETRAKAGLPVETVASVASFFLSRIDVLVDPMLEKIMEEGGAKADLAQKLHGQTAIASAKVAYQMYKEIFGSEQFQKLDKYNARVQRLLWASTSAKNPDYSDVKYVEALIGPETVNTMPQKTLEAYRDHGSPALRLEENVDEAYRVLDGLSELGINIDQVTQQLEEEGVQKFIDPYDELIDGLEEKRERYRVAETT